MRKKPEDGWNLVIEWSNWTFGLWWSWRTINKRKRIIGIEVGPFQWMWQRTDGLWQNLNYAELEQRVADAYPGEVIPVSEGHRVIATWPNLHGEDGEAAAESVARYFGSSAHFVIDGEHIYQNLPTSAWPRRAQEGGFCDPGSLDTSGQTEKS